MKSLWVPLSGAIAQQRKVETLANNIANANTPGFKRDQLVFKEYMTVLDKGHEDLHMPNDEWAPEDFYKSYGSQHSKVKVDGSYTDFAQGQLTPTRNPLDVALSGSGFFELLGPGGIRYSRRGTFTISKDGELINDTGHKVLGTLNMEKLTEGAKIPTPEERVIKLGNGPISISHEGDIFQNDQKIASLSVVEFDDVHALKKEGHSHFSNPHPENRQAAFKTAVHQGFIETSNVNPISEMSELIKAHRHFESIQQAIKAYDNIAGKSVNEISRF